jgi:hypothetical protein
MRVVVCVIAYVFSLGLPLVAAITGSIGPEPPCTELGKALVVFYRPYFELSWGLFGGVGFVVAPRTEPRLAVGHRLQRGPASRNRPCFPARSIRPDHREAV